MASHPLFRGDPSEAPPYTSRRPIGTVLFIGLCPDAHIDFLYEISGTATASDVSLLGGGVCATCGVTMLG